MKKVLFALIPAAILLIFATVVIDWAERRDLVDTIRPDDRVSYPAKSILKKIKKDRRKYWTVDDPKMVRSIFPVKKTDRTFRIVLTGGSFAMGTPYIHQDDDVKKYGGITDWLLADLSHRYPSLDIEVINAAAGAQNSFAVADIVEQMVAADPDLIIVAMGNNEGYVPFSSYNKSFHQWSVYRLLKKTIKTQPPDAQLPFFTPQDPDTAKIEKAFQSNVNRIIQTAQGAGIRLLLSTMPINLSYDGPDPGIHGAGIPVPVGDSSYDEGKKLLEKKKYKEAIDVLAKSRNQAHAAKLMADALVELKRFDDARAFYLTHVQHVPMNRTRPSFNAYIKKTAGESDLLLVDLEGYFEKQSPTGIPDHNLFVDYCHLTWRGYFQSAREMVRVLIANSVLPREKNEPKPAPALDTLIDENNWGPLRSTTKDMPVP